MHIGPTFFFQLDNTLVVLDEKTVARLGRQLAKSAQYIEAIPLCSHPIIGYAMVDKLPAKATSII